MDIMGWWWVKIFELYTYTYFVFIFDSLWIKYLFLFYLEMFWI
jgi:hypothetical protein